MGSPLRSDSEGLGFSLRFNKLQGILAKANNILYVTWLKDCKKNFDAYFYCLTFN